MQHLVRFIMLIDVCMCIPDILVEVFFLPICYRLDFIVNFRLGVPFYNLVQVHIHSIFQIAIYQIIISDTIV
ncbi:hypothetical protein ACJX0J_023123, partial [Zea mays]